MKFELSPVRMSTEVEFMAQKDFDNNRFYKFKFGDPSKLHGVIRIPKVLNCPKTIKIKVVME